jgi:hypothetical protein
MDPSKPEVSMENVPMAGRSWYVSGDTSLRTNGPLEYMWGKRVDIRIIEGRPDDQCLFLDRALHRYNIQQGRNSVMKTKYAEKIKRGDSGAIIDGHLPSHNVQRRT